MLKVYQLEIRTVGSAPNATGYDDVTFTGALESVDCAFLVDEGTTRIDIDELKADGSLGRKILDHAASVADFVHAVRDVAKDSTGTDLTYDSTEPVPARYVNSGRTWRVTIADSEPATPAARVRLVVEV
jgi:hypothetical protein